MSSPIDEIGEEVVDINGMDAGESLPIFVSSLKFPIYVSTIIFFYLHNNMFFIL